MHIARHHLYPGEVGRGRLEAERGVEDELVMFDLRHGVIFSASAGADYLDEELRS